MTLAEKILSLRTARGMSQDDLAEKLEVSRQSVSKWETGQSTPDLDKIIKLADLFGVTVDELVREGERPQPPEPPQPQVVYVERERQGLTAVQKTGVVMEITGAALAVIGIMGAPLLVFAAVALVILGLPLLLPNLFGVSVDELVREGERPQAASGKAREKRELTAVQKIGLVFEAAGVVFTIIGLISKDWPLVYKAAPLAVLSLPLLLAKKRPWLTLCWVLMTLSFVFIRPQQTAWGLPDGLYMLFRYFKLRDPHYSSYFASQDHSHLLYMGIVGIVRGLLTLVLIFFTWLAWKKRRPPEKDG